MAKTTLDERVQVTQRWVPVEGERRPRYQYLVTYEAPRARRLEIVRTYDVPKGSWGEEEAEAAGHFAAGFIAGLRRAGVE